MQKIKSQFALTVLFLFVVLQCAGYSQWVSAGSVAMTGSYPSISVVNPNVVWVAGGLSSPVIFRTTNGGVTWTSIPVTGLAVKALMCIWAIDENTAFVGDGGDPQGTAGGDAIVSKTTNAGVTWTQIFNTGGTAGFFNGIAFSKSNPSFGFAESDPPTGAGQPYYVQKTTNGGVNWTLTNPPGVAGNASAQNSLFAIDQNFYGFGMNTAPMVYITSNGGANWFNGTLGITGTFVAGLSFADNKLLGVAATSNSFPTVARTTNGGTSWVPVSTGGSGTTTLCTVKFINNSTTVYYVGASTTAAIIRKSTDGGATWSTMTAPAGLFNFTHFEVILVGNTVTAYAISPVGNIIKLTETVTLIPKENTTIPDNYSLNQNYPNPFNPSTKISFNLPKNDFVTLKVYNALGLEVATLVNENLSAGVYEYEFKSDNLSTGVYFYKMMTSNFTDTKRMILMK